MQDFLLIFRNPHVLKIKEKLTRPLKIKISYKLTFALSRNKEMIEMGNNFLGIKIWILNDGPENINKFLKCNEGGNLLEPEPTFFG